MWFSPSPPSPLLWWGGADWSQAAARGKNKSKPKKTHLNILLARTVLRSMKQLWQCQCWAEGRRWRRRRRRRVQWFSGKKASQASSSDDEKLLFFGQNLFLASIGTYKLRPVPLLERFLPRCQCLMLWAQCSWGWKAISEWIWLFFSFALNELLGVRLGPVVRVLALIEIVVSIY